MCGEPSRSPTRGKKPLGSRSVRRDKAVGGALGAKTRRKYARREERMCQKGRFLVLERTGRNSAGDFPRNPLEEAACSDSGIGARRGFDNFGKKATSGC